MNQSAAPIARSPSSARRIPARPHSSIASPSCASSRQLPGVTVEHHTGYIRDANGEEVALVDLPGSIVSSRNPKTRRWRLTYSPQDAGHACTGCNYPRTEFDQPAHTLVLAARVIALGIPTCPVEHGRRAAQAGRPCRCAFAGARVRNTSRTGERHYRRRPGRRAKFLSSASANPEPLECP